MYYTVIKHSSHLRTLNKCKKHEPQAMFSNDHRVLSQCNTRLRLLYLLKNFVKIEIAMDGQFITKYFLLPFRGAALLVYVYESPGLQIITHRLRHLPRFFFVAVYFCLLYKHQCFIRISATEKIHIFSHVKLR